VRKNLPSVRTPSPPAGHPHSLLGINVREIGESFTGDNYEVAVNYARNNNYTVVTNTAL